MAAICFCKYVTINLEKNDISRSIRCLPNVDILHPKTEGENDSWITSTLLYHSHRKMNKLKLIIQTSRTCKYLCTFTYRQYTQTVSPFFIIFLPVVYFPVLSSAPLNLKCILFYDIKGKQGVNHVTFFFNHMTVIINKECIVKRNKYCHGRYGMFFIVRL